MRIALALLTLAACKGNGGDSGPTNHGDGAGVVFINEFMASNRTAWADDDGAFPDWVELYNSGDADFPLDGATFTDDLATPDKWAFPDGNSIAAGGYLMVICDGDASAQGGLHTSFSLSSDGEDLGLFDPNGDGIDTLTYDPQTADISMARMPDGGDDWEPATSPTPGASNG